jgi:outer membrane protein TolC
MFGQGVNTTGLKPNQVRADQMVGLAMIFLISIGHPKGNEADNLSEAAMKPVDLLMAEDLFPQLVPILHQAAEQAPSVLARNIDLTVAEANAIIASSDRYPSVGGILRYDYRREDRVTRVDVENSNKLYFFFQARYPLIHWGAVKAASEIGKIGVKVAEGKLDAAYRKLIQSIRSRYLGLVLRKMELVKSVLDLERQKSDLDFKNERLKAGEIASNRVGSARLRLEEAELRYERAGSDYHYMFRRFRRLVGNSTLSDDVVADHFPDVGHNPDHLSALLSKFVNGGFDDDPRVKEAELKIRREEQNYRIHHVRNRPKLDLTTGITQDEISYSRNPEDRDKFGTMAVFVGIAVNWSIFDGFKTRGLKRASLLRLNQLRRNRWDVDAQLLDEANQAAERIEFSARTLVFGERRYRVSKAKLKIVEGDVESGVASEESVELTKSRVQDAEIDLAARRADYLNAVSAFLTLVGADEVAKDFSDDYSNPEPE